MMLQQLQRCDLNLLLCLHTLLQEQSVTLTAQRLHLSQSAVSKSLARLRHWFDDPLFIRSSHGLTPTPRAIAMQQPLQQLLEGIAELAQPKTFDPRSSPRQFRFSLLENIYPLLMPLFVNDLLSQGNHLSLDAQPWSNDAFHQLLNGDIDFAITGKDIHPHDAALTIQPPKGIADCALHTDHQVCLLHPNHPALDAPWDLECYLNQRHVQVRCGGNSRWLLDFKLAEQSLARDIAINVPDFNSAASLVTHTTLILTAPSHFAVSQAKQHNLAVLPLPYDLPEMAYTLFWSIQRENDPGLKWMKSLIMRRCATLNAALGQ